jgi:homoserine O-acetyltransferase
MQFPRFTIRDMVKSQYRLVSEQFGIQRLLSVIGASMGGMQALQWAVSYPDAMESIVPIVPLGRTTAWTTGILEMLRQSITTDPNWDGGNYPASAPPEKGMRLWAGWLSGVVVRTPSYQEALYPNNNDAIAFLKGVRDAGWRRMDAVDWIYQSWAYDAHNVGTTPGFDGNYVRALKSIKAKTFILAGSGDLLNPEFEAQTMTQFIPHAQYFAINALRPMGHLSGAGTTMSEAESQNQEIGKFLASLTTMAGRPAAH